MTIDRRTQLLMLSLIPLGIVVLVSGIFIRRSTEVILGILVSGFGALTYTIYGKKTIDVTNFKRPTVISTLVRVSGYSLLFVLTAYSVAIVSSVDPTMYVMIPRIDLIAIITATLGIIFGVGFPLLVEYTDSPKTVENLGNLTVYGFFAGLLIIVPTVSAVYAVVYLLSRTAIYGLGVIRS